MNKLGYAIVVGAAALMAAPTLEAQVRQQGPVTYPQTSTRYPQTSSRSSQSIPPGQMPPAGMCRVWIDGLPPGRQPAPTDCATAQANVPPNGRVIYGSGTQGGVYGRNGGYDSRSEKKREKWERKQEKEREKAWKKAHKNQGEDEDDDDDDDHDGDGHHQRGTVWQNRSGRHEEEEDDDRRTSNRRGVTAGQRVCVDANRDGICDDVQGRLRARRP